MDSTKGEIRVIDISPAKSPLDSIIGHLRVVSLRDQPEYEALSYVWGDSRCTNQIILDGKKFAVTGNLFEALTQLRDVKKARTLWIDAVCINQKNDTEKTAQVMIMGKVYSQASRVLVWLSGDEPPGLLDDIATFGNDQERHFTESPLSLLVLSMIDWWHRAWTFQEAALARNILFHVGNKYFDLKDLEAYCNSLHQHLFQSNACCRAAFDEEPVSQTVFASALATLQQLFNSRGIISQGKQGLLTLILGNKDRAATDPRDKVYAYLGLAHGIPAEFVRYELPLKDWVIHISTKLIQHDMDLEIVRHASPSGMARDDKERISGLPSWCPDWIQSTKSRISYITGQRFDRLHEQFSASAQTKNKPFFPTAEILGVSGVLCDTIMKVGQGSSCLSGPGDDPQILRQWCRLVVSSSLLHDARCDVCEKIIYGVRHKCLVCPDFEFCTQCFVGSRDKHSDHSFASMQTRSPESKGDWNQGKATESPLNSKSLLKPWVLRDTRHTRKEKYLQLHRLQLGNFKQDELSFP